MQLMLSVEGKDFKEDFCTVLFRAIVILLDMKLQVT